MARAIDAEKVEAKLQCDIDHCAGYFNKAVLSMLLDYIRTVPTLTQPNEWVSVDEKFPEINQKVIAFLEGMYSMAEFYGTYYDGTPIWSYTGMWGDPTHWMSLPAPPTKET